MINIQIIFRFKTFELGMGRYGLKNILRSFLVFIVIMISMMIIQGILCIHQETKTNPVSLEKNIIFPIFILEL